MNLLRRNLLTRITDTFTEAVNKNGKLSRFIIFVLDDDIIQFTKFDKVGVATLFGRYLQFIIDEVKVVIEERKSQLPKKAIKVSYPVVYWLAAPYHSNWHNDWLRGKYNLCLESIVKQKSNMHVIKIKEVWDKNNVQLVDKVGQLTSMGVMTYWMAINCAVQFNAERFCRYGTDSKGKKDLKRKQGSRQDSGDSKRKTT